MKLQFFRPSSLGVAAVMVAMCGYAGAQTAPANNEAQPAPGTNMTQTTPDNNVNAVTPENNNASATTRDDDNASAATGNTNLRLVTADARLMRTVDSSHAAQGQVVTAKLTTSVKASGETDLPKGTMLIGKVQQVQTSSNSGPARMSIVFDHARLPNGQSMPVKATLLGAYPADTADYWVDTSTNGSLLAVQPHTIPADQKVDQEPGTLGHIELHSAVQSNASGVFVDKDGNFKLKNGTRFQIAIAPMSRG